MNYLSEFLWEKNQRSINEDSLAISQLLINSRPLVLAIICDGVGGYKNGDFASSYVINTLRSTLEYIKSAPDTPILSYLQFIKRTIYKCHTYLSSLADPCGTTLTLVLIYNRRCYLLNIGDSRLYYGKRVLRQISKDNTNQFNRLTQAIGLGTLRRLKYKSFRIRQHSKLLLCTDGFYNKSHSLITKKHYFNDISSEASIRQKLCYLYSLSLNKKETDNATAILIYAH